MVYILMNPLANNHKGEEATEQAKKLFDAATVKIVDVRHLTDVPVFISRLSTEDKIVVAGGDGTVARFIDAVYDLKISQQVFLYPCGSGNDFWHDIRENYPADTKLYPLNDYMKDLPEVVVNGVYRRFINGVGFGIDGYCCEQGDIHREKSKKAINYTKIAIKGILYDYKRANATVTVDGETKSYKNVILAPCMMGRYYGGGIMVAPMQDRMNKERVVTSVVWRGSRLGTLLRISSAFKGKHVKYKKNIDVRQGHSVKVVFEKPCALQIDGETFRNVSSYSVTFHNHDNK